MRFQWILVILLNELRHYAFQMIEFAFVHSSNLMRRLEMKVVLLKNEPQ